MSADNDEVVKKDDAEADEAAEQAKKDAEEAKGAALAAEVKLEAAKAAAESDDAKDEAKAADEKAADEEEAVEAKPKAAAIDAEEIAETRAKHEDEGLNAGEMEAEAKADVHAAEAEHHEEPLVEEDRPKNGIIAVTIVSTLIAVVLSVLGVNEIYLSFFGGEVQEKVLGRTSSELRELRAEEKAKLHRYQWVSKKDGVVRIPVERAAELTIAEYREKAKQAALAPKPAPEAPKPDGTAAPDAPKPDGSAAPDAPKPGGTAAPEAPKPEAPKPEAPKEH